MIDCYADPSFNDRTVDETSIPLKNSQAIAWASPPRGNFLSDHFASNADFELSFLGFGKMFWN